MASSDVSYNQKALDSITSLKDFLNFLGKEETLKKEEAEKKTQLVGKALNLLENMSCLCFKQRALNKIAYTLLLKNVPITEELYIRMKTNFDSAIESFVKDVETYRMASGYLQQFILGEEFQEINFLTQRQQQRLADFQQALQDAIT